MEVLPINNQVDRWRQLQIAMQDYAKKHTGQLEMTPNKGLSFTVNEIHWQGLKLALDFEPHGKEVVYTYLRPTNRSGGMITFGDAPDFAYTIHGRAAELDALLAIILEPFIAKYPL